LQIGFLIMESGGLAKEISFFRCHYSLFNYLF